MFVKYTRSIKVMHSYYAVNRLFTSLFLNVLWQNTDYIVKPRVTIYYVSIFLNLPIYK